MSVKKSEDCCGKLSAADAASENFGKIDLEMIEVQSGIYLENDDIVRFEDKNGRV